jgi:hypothetical protein
LPAGEVPSLRSGPAVRMRSRDRHAVPKNHDNRRRSRFTGGHGPAGCRK